MRSLYRIIVFLPLLLFLTCSFSLAEEFTDHFPKVASSYLLKVNGEILYAHKPEKRLPPANLTKLMTAMLVLEHSNRLYLTKSLPK